LGIEEDRREAIANRTFADFGSERLRVLCSALDVAEQSGELLRVFQRWMSGWGNCPIGQSPRYGSSVADDGAPFELAMAVSRGGVEVQAYVEPQGEPPTLSSNLIAGRAMLAEITAPMANASARLSSVEDLFFPDAPCPPFTSWIGASFHQPRGVRLKAYLNPQVQGANRTLDVVTEAMTRLGFARSWERVRDQLARTGPRRDDVAILSMDLHSGPDARVKLYIRNNHASVRDIEAMARLAHRRELADVGDFYYSLVGHGGPYTNKPPITEFTFLDPNAPEPEQITLEFPIGSYVANDEVARQCIVRCLRRFGLPTDRYERATSALALRPLADGTGMHAHVTLRRDGHEPRIGIYWATEAYR
jgi:DMATS type aromatic prenyltransferase